MLRFSDKFDKVIADRIESDMTLLSRHGTTSFATSGTISGNPKLVIQKNRDLIDNAESFNKTAGVDQSVSMYNCLPYGHMGSYLNATVCPIVAGGDVFVSAFSPFTFWDEINNNGCNTAWISPTMAIAILKIWRGDPEATLVAKDMSNMFCGFSRLPANVRQEWADTFLIPLRASYGTTELMLISVQDEKSSWACSNDVGVPLCNTVVNIADSKEIMVSGRHLNYKYSDGRKRVDGGEWHPTGDYGFMDSNGYLHISGRRKEIIKRGGATIYPGDIEDKVREIDGVGDVAVVGVDDDYWGECVALFIDGNISVDIAELNKELSDGYHIDRVVKIEEFPRTPTGKIMKSKLRVT